MQNIQTIRNNINKLYKEKKKKDTTHHNSRWNKYYQHPRWKQVRAQYYTMHPICEICEKKGVITPTDEIHHMHVFGNAPTEEEKYRLLLDTTNLCACCRMHHDMFHEYMRVNHTDYVTREELFRYEVVHYTFE